MTKLGKLEDSLRQKASDKAFKEYLKSVKLISDSYILSRIYPYEGQYTVCGHQLTELRGTSDIETVEKAINLRADEIYEQEVHQLLDKFDAIKELFEVSTND